jgi:UDP-N-acetylmuramoyl-L-alanyl-D-glutamate--2,6-diaminopimelate ligase
MRLSELLEALPPGLAPIETPPGGMREDPPIRGIQIDSRSVAPGELFVALRGSQADGHHFLGAAGKLGAAAFLVESLPDGVDLQGRPTVVVRDTRRALAALATRFYGDPSAELTLIGVTGTNGKTSTTYLVESILQQAGREVGVIGTVEVRYAGERHRAINTTPESLELQRLLRAMRTRGIDAVAMEVSSHGLALGRVDGCRFAVGAITNLTQDHLDFHGTMEAYRDAKALLFRRHIAENGAAVVHLDDPHAQAFVDAARAAGVRLVTTSRLPASGADVALLSADVNLSGTRALVRLPSALASEPLAVALPLLGDFNLENMLVAIGIATALRIAPVSIAAGLAAVPQVPGRVERVDAGLPGTPTVLVDYAHTPDAVEKLLRTVRPLARGRLITVFGCGGDRDRAKRPLMAEAVARWSDRVVATSDNPRTEDPMAILAEVERGLGGLCRVGAVGLDAAAASYVVLADRRAAIELALAIARPEDTVVIAGKGHEDYQIIGRERLPFDDRAEARRALARRAPSAASSSAPGAA